jgi:hypothetical protein
MRLINLLVSKLNGTFEYKYEDETNFIIIFPILEKSDDKQENIDC